MGCACAAEAPVVMPRPWRNAKVVTSVCSGLLLLTGFVGGYLGLPAGFQAILYIAAVLVGGYYFGREALEELVKEREIGIELLMSTAAIVAGVMGQWAEAATLVFLYSISEAAEGYTAERARHAIRALMDLAPKTALVRRGDEEIRIPVEQIRVGDVFIVLPGESVATDGEVVDGHSSVNQAPVTGESVPVEKLPGSQVFAATLNGEGALTVRATKTFADNTLSRIIHLVEAAQASKGRSQRFIERFGKRYSPSVLGVGILIGLLPPLFGLPWEDWLTRATVFIVAAAPCALVISVPITLVAAIGTAGRNGLLIKGGVHLENLAKVRVVALDKTGTLTLGRPQVTDVIPLDGQSEREVLAAAAALELRSQHPLAQAVLERAKSEGIAVNPAQDFLSLTGAGARGRIEGVDHYVGNPRLFEGLGVPVAAAMPRIEALQREGKTVVLVGTDRALDGLIAIADPLRPEAVRAVAELKRAGIERVVMLTGDNPLAAEAIARQVGVDEVFAELSPEGKARKVAELEARYGKVMMVGDGVNDAPALAAAHVGVAMGAAGTDVALETADVVLMSDNLARLPYLISFSRRTWQVIRQNLALSAVVIGVLIAGAVGGYLTLPIAVLAHEISEFVVIGNGLRMLRR
ncbi:heavy metal translocating P-type ATPase [Tepidiphilus olei]|uniref:heavy metal translocating P-type ATPase n=1 Tax=Tepidiphilus olei TaxID=2502184 RepID=UPI00115DEFFF|nr:cation-translocating P-type ATPase [Tepidiphilus olei]